MPKFIIERSIPPMTSDELATVARRSMDVLAQMPHVRWIRSYVSEVDGKIYCEYDAPSPEAVREHALRAGIPVDRIIPVALEISPAMFV